MTGCWILMTLLLWPLDDVRKPSVVEKDRARRAAIVDPILGEGATPQFRSNRSFTTELLEVADSRVKPDDDNNNNNNLKNRPGMRAPVAVVEFQIALELENFDRWVFGNMVDDRSRRAWLETRLKVRSDQAGKSLGLSQRQVEKLQLAGRGDIKRFFDRVDELRPEFNSLRVDIESGRRFLTDDLKPTSLQFQYGPFGDDSLFTKTLKKIEKDTPETRQEGN